MALPKAKMIDIRVEAVGLVGETDNDETFVIVKERSDGAPATVTADGAVVPVAADPPAAEPATKTVDPMAPKISPAAKRGLLAGIAAVSEKLAAVSAFISGIAEDESATYVPWQAWSVIEFATAMLNAVSGRGNCCGSGCCAAGCCCGSGCSCSGCCSKMPQIGSAEWEAGIAMAMTKATDEASAKAFRATLAAGAAAEATAKTAAEADVAHKAAQADLAGKLAAAEADVVAAKAKAAEVEAALETERKAHEDLKAVALEAAQKAKAAATTVGDSGAIHKDRQRDPNAPGGFVWPKTVSQAKEQRAKEQRR